jgi:hypothetical protein
MRDYNGASCKEIVAGYLSLVSGYLVHRTSIQQPETSNYEDRHPHSHHAGTHAELDAEVWLRRIHPH